jgi:hypothetical protein
MFQRMSLVLSCLGVLALCGFSSPAFGGQILSDNFNATGGVPNNWTQISGAPGDVTESPHNLTITDSLGTSSGIASTLASSVFNPQGMVTTFQVQINSVSAEGNAVFGLYSLDGKSFLAAGIDAQGDVFIVEQQNTPSIAETIVPIGLDSSYRGGSILMNFIINSNGVEVTAPGFNSGEILFSTSLNNFSLAAAFGGGATEGLVAASQTGFKGGSASFGSVTVSTALTSSVPEPSSIQILAIGLAGLGVVGSLRRRQRDQTLCD